MKLAMPSARMSWRGRAVAGRKGRALARGDLPHRDCWTLGEQVVGSRLMWKMQGRSSGSSASSLLDDLIGPRKHGRWDRQTERLGSPHVDHQLELGGLLHGKVGGLRPLEDLVDVGRYPLNHGQQAWSIGDEAPRVRELS